jgi:hypothetical protein
MRNREKQGGTDGPRDFGYYTDCSKKYIHILIKKKYPLHNSEKVDIWCVQKQQLFAHGELLQMFRMTTVKFLALLRVANN